MRLVKDDRLLVLFADADRLRSLALVGRSPTFAEDGRSGCKPIPVSSYCKIFAVESHCRISSVTLTPIQHFAEVCVGVQHAFGLARVLVALTRSYANITPT